MPKELFRLCESQRDLFLIIHKLTTTEWLDYRHFQEVWQQSVEMGVKNLFVEILAQKHLQLSNPHSAFLVVGNMGARILLYYSSLKNQWLLRHEWPAETEKQVDNMLTCLMHMRRSQFPRGQ